MLERDAPYVQIIEHYRQGVVDRAAERRRHAAVGPGDRGGVRHVHGRATRRKAGGGAAGAGAGDPAARRRDGGDGRAAAGGQG